MAKQTGLLKYSGTMGGVRHFKIKGLKGDFAGVSGGPSASQIATAPEFVRTRENMREFGASATAAKSIRVALSEIIKQMSDPRMTGRLTSIMKKINLEDQTEARGYRAILISTQRQYLKGFAFDRNMNFDSIFVAPFSSVPTAGRDGATITVPAFNPANLINSPAGATHFRLVQALACVSDFAYNATNGLYEALDVASNELSNVVYSDYIPLTEPVAANFDIVATLPGSPTITADASVLQCIGIEFHQAVGANFYRFSSGNALKIYDIF